MGLRIDWRRADVRRNRIKSNFKVNRLYADHHQPSFEQRMAVRERRAVAIEFARRRRQRPIIAGAPQ